MFQMDFNFHFDNVEMQWLYSILLWQQLPYNAYPIYLLKTALVMSMYHWLSGYSHYCIMLEIHSKYSIPFLAYPLHPRAELS